MSSSTTGFTYCSTAHSSPLDFSSLSYLSLSANPLPSPHTPPLPLRIQSPHSSRVLPAPLLHKSRSRTRASPSAMAAGSTTIANIAVAELCKRFCRLLLTLPQIHPQSLMGLHGCIYPTRVPMRNVCGLPETGLQGKIKLVPIDLQNRPTWYKEKVYPPNKVPSLEHNNEVKGESLDLLKYIDSSFEGPSLFPSDPAKRQFAEELLSYIDSFNKRVISSFKVEGMNDADAAFDYFETALSKFDNGPFLLAEFSLVDIAYAPFIERFQPFLLDLKKYDITAGRPKLAAWIKEMNKNEAYKQTQRDPKEHVQSYKKRFSVFPAFPTST
ncbi:hypothetical protein RHSIM_Rhsim03G0238500 [Rhododendron simsii]|uniref:GST C-terminal domain-containing protein n=1 Tax=Rhododendron simsii TaxID=118357 RepID=A0A834H6W6_RHOSS|nr:hypothetical protein RHSIM_Rhsim03G0238500 [Rhododendron simsii]